MHRLSRVRLLLASVLLAVVGLAAGTIASAGGERPSSVRQASARAVASASGVVARLSLAQLAGQRIIYAYAGATPPSTLLAQIRHGEAAGVIFFAPNVRSPAQLRTVVRDLQRANAASPVRAPLLILVDQEGGLVRRLPGAPQFSEKQIGASPDGEALAAQAGTGAGHNLLADGINVNLAPVLDVFSTPGNFIDQYQRSYSANPAIAAQLGSAFISAQQQTGVAATAKHFPGLGAAGKGQDTDRGPVTLNVPLADLRGTDEYPYGLAIAAGVKLVMLSWATYPSLDPNRPAGLSTTVIGGELRGRLGFRGVTITDSIGAGALAPYGSYGHRGVLAAQAGDDLMLCAVTDPTDNNVHEGIHVLDGIESALARHTLSLSSAQQAAARVIALRSQP